jgi:hypothetical protein
MNASAHNSGPFPCQAHAVTTKRAPKWQRRLALLKEIMQNQQELFFLVCLFWTPKGPPAKTLAIADFPAVPRTHIATGERCIFPRHFLAAGPGVDSSMVESPAKTPVCIFQKFIQS